MKKKILFSCIVIILIFGYISLKNYSSYSNSYEVMSYSSDYEIGRIIISSIDLDRKLMQGLDNNYYLNHNYLNMDSEYGEFFLDNYGDLINNNYPIIYSNVNNLDINKIRINDIVNIQYLDSDLCYKVLSINRKISYELIIKLVGDNKEFNIFLSKIECKI